MNVLDLFSGIGGFSLGLERAGFDTVAFCEIEKFPQKVLAEHWPGVPIYDDVRELTYDKLKSDGIPRIDIIVGGFPCQDISVAGKQAGIGEGTRSGLWSECARLLGEIRPKYAIFENVTALLAGEQGRWFQRVLFDISALGYAAEWHCIPASELGAHHHRDRVWIIAYPEPQGFQGTQRKGSASEEGEPGGHAAELCGNVAHSISSDSGRGSSPGNSDGQKRKPGKAGRAGIQPKDRGTRSDHPQPGGENVALADSLEEPIRLDGRKQKGSRKTSSKRSKPPRGGSGESNVAHADNDGSPAAKIEKSTPQGGDGSSPRKKQASESPGLCSAGVDENVAHPDSGTREAQRQGRILEKSSFQRAARRHSDGCFQIGEEWAFEPGLGRVVDGVPDRAHRLKALGNAVVPQIPELIGNAIMEAENIGK